MKRALILAVGGVLLLGGNLMAADSWEIDGYKLSGITIAQTKDIVTVTGKIEGGKPCQELVVEFYLYDEYSTEVYMYTTVKCLEKDCKSFKAIAKTKEYTDDGKPIEKRKWEVAGVFTHCLSE